MLRSPRTRAATAVLIGGLFADPAAAHVSEGGFVLLLPTDFYSAAGVWTVALTVAALALAPARWTSLWSRSIRLRPAPPRALGTAASLASAGVFFAVCWIGIVGARDPLANPAPLMIWTVWWVFLIIAQGLLGDLWRWLNPWSGFVRLVGARPVLRLPRWVGRWPAIVLFLLFGAFALADPAPDDPARLARLAFLYWAATFAFMILFGARAWSARGEFTLALGGLVARLAPLGLRGGAIRLGPPGWRLTSPGGFGLAILSLVFLGFGSFDGLNETFWWLAFIGVNPLEFPGRSAVVADTIGGLFACVGLLIAVFAGAVAAGLRLAGGEVAFTHAFARLAPTVLPIAFAYHFAHYLVVGMVNGQYALAAAADPLGRGDDLLGLGTFYVTTGFLNARDSVEAIYLAQAGAVVAGHVLSVILAHAVALRLFRDARRATISQIPLAAFMIAYTFLGLWLLAAPKGA
ncbi:MAG: hypothetical protein AAGF90_02345 [Pseudomonadota bacterium]